MMKRMRRLFPIMLGAVWFQYRFESNFSLSPTAASKVKLSC